MASSIILPGRSTTQPSSWAGVDWGKFSPAAAYIGGRWALQGPSGGQWTANSGTLRGSSAGSCLHFAFSTGSIARKTITSITPGSGPLTVAGVFAPTGASGANGTTAISLGATSATEWLGIGQAASANNTPSASFFNGTTQTVSSVTGLPSGGLPLNVPIALALKVVSTTDYRLFYGGQQFNFTTSVSPLVASTNFALGGAYRNGAAASNPVFAGNVLQAWIDPFRTYHDAELLLWSENPWSLVRRSRRLYFTSSGGESFSGTITTGSLVKTGQIPADVIGFHFVSTVGSLVKMGQVPSLAKGFIFSPTAGSIVKTGQVPTLTLKFTFTPGSGSLVKTGQIPTLTRKFTFTPGSGSIVKTGQQPTLYAPFTPKNGAIVKTGHIPILTISSFGAALAPHSWFVKAIGVKTKGSVHSQVDSDSGDTP